jgi:hypothetical protein
VTGREIGVALVQVRHHLVEPITQDTQFIPAAYRGAVIQPAGLHLAGGHHQRLHRDHDTAGQKERSQQSEAQCAEAHECEANDHRPLLGQQRGQAEAQLDESGGVRTGAGDLLAGPGPNPLRDAQEVGGNVEDGTACQVLTFDETAAVARHLDAGIDEGWQDHAGSPHLLEQHRAVAIEDADVGDFGDGIGALDQIAQRVDITDGDARSGSFGQQVDQDRAMLAQVLARTGDLFPGHHRHAADHGHRDHRREQGDDAATQGRAPGGGVLGIHDSGPSMSG